MNPARTCTLTATPIPAQQAPQPSMALTAIRQDVVDGGQAILVPVTALLSSR